MTTPNSKTDPIFQPLTGDNVDNDALEVTEIESLCIQCYENGTTRLLLTKIPFFKDIVISSFECENKESCGFKNNEILNAGKIAENGIKLTFQMNDKRDLFRNCVRSEFCTVSVPELEFEIPVGKDNKGIFTTVEGLLNRAFDDIERDQPLRRIQQPEVAGQIDAFLEKAREKCGLVEGTVPSTNLVFYDPSGNSYIDNPHAPFPDNRLRVDYFVRTLEQSQMMGYDLAAEQSDDPENKNNLAPLTEEPEPELENETLTVEAHGGLDLNDEVLTIASNCPNCNSVCQANFKTVQVPFFKDVIIMATVCDAKSCGYKSNEVKSGSGFSDKGQKITLTLNSKSESLKTDLKIDLARDILKSETASISIPTIDFEIGRGAIEGKFTTVEGLLQDIQRVVKNNPFTTGDSTIVENKNDNLGKFNKNIEDILAGEMHVKLVLDDPAGNSYVQNVNAPDDDPQLEILDYERTFEQNEDLGLNQMVTEGYEKE